MKTTHVRVKHEKRSGTYFITGADEYSRGLCSMSYDLEDLMIDARRQLEVLLLENHQMKAMVVPGNLNTIKAYLDGEMVGKEMTWLAVEKGE